MYKASTSTACTIEAAGNVSHCACISAMPSWSVRVVKGKVDELDVYNKWIPECLYAVYLWMNSYMEELLLWYKTLREILLDKFYEVGVSHVAFNLMQLEAQELCYHGYVSNVPFCQLIFTSG